MYYVFMVGLVVQCFRINLIYPHANFGEDWSMQLNKSYKRSFAFVQYAPAWSNDLNTPSSGQIFVSKTKKVSKALFTNEFNIKC